ncbi:hypothetical protein GCM10010472_01460 [Pseudonocardia halophobica]|uniref:Uncharacterized protein n=1 Tax=Pseudonocardia halophobica TaxID=29401 RepID=A0A9W6KYS5_9PSEU|nr:hypothetical protein [Pseudonocardia halophobica]GLL10486.1 hypothetical protein GCM10017577_16260 [Pseudonocardia halophobica]
MRALVVLGLLVGLLGAIGVVALRGEDHGLVAALEEAGCDGVVSRFEKTDGHDWLVVGVDACVVGGVVLNRQRAAETVESAVAPELISCLDGLVVWARSPAEPGSHEPRATLEKRYDRDPSTGPRNRCTLQTAGSNDGTALAIAVVMPLAVLVFGGLVVSLSRRRVGLVLLMRL